jgi:MYXO-CTERM domain-containing protein
MKTMIALALFSGVASAQTFDFDLTMGSYSFDGTISPTVAVTDGIGGGMLTEANTGSSGGVLINLEGASSAQAAGSEIWTLQYTLSGTQIVGAFYTQDGNNGWSCGNDTPSGGNDYLGACKGSVVDPPAAAPEMDSGTALAALTLLGGLLLVRRGKRA